jgi:hypothetical protein
MATEWDLFASWEQITTMLIATPDHKTREFGESAGRWQTQMNELGHATPPAVQEAAQA